MKNKQISWLLVILISMAIYYIGFQHYNNYKKKERYKHAFINDLENALVYIENNLISDIEIAQKKTDQLFKDFLEKEPSSNKELTIQNLKINITNIFMSIIFVEEYFHLENWRSAQQSEILSQFSMYELNGLNNVDNKAQKFIATFEELQKFGFISNSFYHPLFSKDSSHEELLDISRKYHRVLSYSLYKISDLSYAYSNTLKILDPENEYLTKIDSLRTKK